MRKNKKLISVLFVLAAVIGICVIAAPSAFADGDRAEIFIDGIAAPVAGQVAEYNFTFATQEEFPIEPTGCSWMVSEEYPEDFIGEWYYSEDAVPFEFEAGKYYSFSVFMVMSPEMSVAKELAVYINGEPALIDYAAGDEAIIGVRAWRTFYCEAAIDHVSISEVVPPVAGEYASFDYTLPDGAAYTYYKDEDGDMGAWVETDTPITGAEEGFAPENVYYASSGCAATGEPLVFKGGKYYTFYAWVDSLEGFRFSENVMPDINGETAVIDENYGDSVNVCYTFYCKAPVESVELNKTMLTIIQNDTFRLEASVWPENAEDKAVIWESSDPSIVAVDESGKLTAVGLGMATVTVTTVDGEKTASCDITVVLREWCESITVYGSFAKLNYVPGESFDPAGIIAVANCKRFGGEGYSVDISDEIYFDIDPISGASGETVVKVYADMMGADGIVRVFETSYTVNIIGGNIAETMKPAETGEDVDSGDADGNGQAIEKNQLPTKTKIIITVASVAAGGFVLIAIAAVVVIVVVIKKKKKK